MKKRTLFLCAAFFALSTFSLMGCSEKKEETPGRTVSNANTQEDEIKRIQNNPNMPPQAKLAAIKGLKDAQNAAQKSQAASSR